RLVEVKPDGRRGTAARREASRLVLRLTRTRGAQRNTGHLADHVLDGRDVLLSEIGSTERRYGDGRRLHRRLALLCGDHDLFEFTAAFGRGGRGGRGGRIGRPGRRVGVGLRRAGEQRCAEQGGQDGS